MGGGAIVGHKRNIQGRIGEIDAIRRLIDSVDGAGPKVLVLSGEPGAGKSTLLDHAVAEAAARGGRTLRVRGYEGEQGLGLAGVHQLLHPILHEAERLPARHCGALDEAFGAVENDARRTADPLAIRAGVLSLLSESAAERPLLIVVDDAQWLDIGSLDVLAFVARRLEGERIAMLVAARDEAVPARFDRDFPHLTTGPLDRAAAGLVLDAQPQPPRGKARAQILDQAAGNPLALIELARAHAKDPGGHRTGPVEALPLTARLERLFAADLPGLPHETRRALLLAAAAGSDRLSDVLHAAPCLADPEVWRPAEQAGLVRVESGDVHLRHPLVRAAIYQDASFADRREAHLALATALAHEPDRRAWHLAAAALGPDEEIAHALAESAERSRRRGGYAAAATALERAAELTPDTERRAGRLLAAATYAMYAGHPQWVGEIAARVATLTDDPRLLAEASLRSGWSLAVTLRHDDALGFLLPAAESMAAAAPGLALTALGTAATSATKSGDPFYRAELRRIADVIAPQPDRTEELWIQAVADPFTGRDEAVRRLNDAVGTRNSSFSFSDLLMLGGTAWILDETELAVRILGQAVDHHRSTATAGANCTVAQALGTALFESGAWAEAQSTTEAAFCMATEAGADNISTASLVLQATLRAARGDHAGARAQAADALDGVDLHKSRSLYVRRRYALGLAALAEGDHRTAYGHLRRTFTQGSEPAPVHHHASLYCVADIAAAATPADRADDARAVLRAAEATLAEPRSPRLNAIMHRASALLSEPDDAEPHFRAALADPAGTQWPFEHALTQLDFGEWLRRHRRSAEARDALHTALDIFERLQARPWIERASAELRAAGVAVADSKTPDAVADLTPQELRIAQLAAEGLTNREIGARLYLSPRTAGYHLHKIFPKLGITARAQLRDVLGP
ncbi:helix-turn-helix transcriptional regulator [Yinghuangia seranimata]|uniref:helix-turn-helix transcriptional regulator n=1 Tax=Yinghuangia seranimata TaxID=408067 RepID=UPI00248B8C41|nr:AAA family ATPase [Yinghuangia seranimata]MDI2131262.1 AAA family ATPase [Yinghuangia seranimata]